jgi:cyclopropane fatty-acyl-phospholipid synthase-like methyltransferase
MKKFTNETMWEILTSLETMISNTKPGMIISFKIPNPDHGIRHYSGSRIDINGLSCLHHNWKAWGDLAELLYCRMLTPKPIGEDEVILYFQKLDKSDSFHQTQLQDKKEKYGTGSHFSTIQKNEEPAFLFAYLRALRQVKIEDRRSILDLGINSGDEFDLIRTIVNESDYQQMQLIGIDHSASVIKKATARFPEENVTFHCQDINHLDELSLPKADLLLSIGTLQSPGIEFKPLFMSLIQNYLTPDGAVILGFPNCRWIDGEMIYGAKAPNYNFPEMSLVIKDIYFCKKYLQQHKFRVTITGKDYLFLTATRIGISKNED